MRIWTVNISGGNSFKIEVPNHPTLEHDGINSVWQTNLDPPQIAAIKDIAQQNGATVQVYSDGGDSKQEAIAQAQKMKTEGWKTERCPLCYFCDLTIPSKCGKQSWDNRVLAIAMKHPKAAESAALCPLNPKNG